MEINQSLERMAHNLYFEEPISPEDFDALLHAIELLKNKWHRWPAEKPDDGAWCVVRYRGKALGKYDCVCTEVANWLFDLWWLDWNTNGLDLDVIQWMYLPEPLPEEE